MNYNQNSYFFIQNAFEIAICKMAAILSWSLYSSQLCKTLTLVLTHLPLDKMAASLADNIFKCIFLNENVWILIKISLNFVHKGLVDNKPGYWFR